MAAALSPRHIMVVYAPRINQATPLGLGHGRINNMLSALHDELIACLQGVQVASNMGIGKLILETDALNVQLALQSQSFDVRPEVGLIEELKSLSKLNLSEFVC